MTAAHVVTAATEHGQLALAGPGREQPMMGAARVEHFETWPDRDVALLFCNAPDVTLLDTWLERRVQVLTDLSAFGYPHAVTTSSAGDRLDVVFRAYKGYVITIRGFERLNGSPAVYEVSCPFPEGMSGAPVIWNVGDRLVVAGVVLGVDTVSYGGVEHSVGIAMASDEIAPLHSEQLGGVLGNKLGLTAATYTIPDVPGETGASR
jgi:hypothetical protein